MSTPESEAANPMDGIETLLHSRFEATVGDVALDVPSLVSAGTTKGQRLRRNRRILQGSMAVSAAVVVAGIGVVGANGGLFDNTAPPAQRVQEMVPSNARAQAAALIAVLPPDLKAETWLGQGDTQGAHSFGAHSGGTWQGKIYNVTVATAPIEKALPLDCKGRASSSPITETCRLLHLAGGGIARLDVNVQDPGSPHVQEVLDLIVFRPHEYISFMWDVARPTDEQRATMTQSALAVAHDPALGLETYQRFVDHEGSVPQWHPWVPPTTPPRR